MSPVLMRRNGSSATYKGACSSVVSWACLSAFLFIFFNRMMLYAAMAATVTNRPDMLMGERGSPNMIPAAAIVRASLKMPQTLSVTTLVRFNRANSEDVMRKARTPGKRIIAIPMAWPLSLARSSSPAFSDAIPSTGMAMNRRTKNMMGVRKNRDEKGFEVAGFRRSSICVRDQRRPEKKEAIISRMKPNVLKAVSPATIIMTPTVMTRMMAPSRHEGFSRRKMMANPSTNPRVEDLHMALEEC